MPIMPFGPDKAELAKFNPIARVPALQIADGEMLVDSAAIIDYLDSLVGPERALTPATQATPAFDTTMPEAETLTSELV